MALPSEILLVQVGFAAVELGSAETQPTTAPQHKDASRILEFVRGQILSALQVVSAVRPMGMRYALATNAAALLDTVELPKIFAPIQTIANPGLEDAIQIQLL